MSERFRLIYLKSPKTEESSSDDFSPESKKVKDLESSETPKTSQSLFSFEIIINQAKKDLKHPDPNVRILAIKFLKKCEPTISIPLIENVLNDPNPDVRNHCLKALVELKDPNLINKLKKCLRDEDPMVRVTALRGIFQIYENIDINILMQILDDESPFVRQKIATLLGWNHIKGILPILVELSKDKDPKVRKSALFSLIAQYPEECEERILKAIYDPDPELKGWAKEMIEKLIAKPIKK